MAERKKSELQEQLYNDMFTKIPQRYLQLMIRELHEPQNDNADSTKLAFDEKNFEYCRHTLHIAKAAQSATCTLANELIHIALVAFRCEAP